MPCSEACSLNGWVYSPLKKKKDILPEQVLHEYLKFNGYSTIGDVFLYLGLLSQETSRCPQVFLRPPPHSWPPDPTYSFAEHY